MKFIDPERIMNQSQHMKKAVDAMRNGFKKQAADYENKFLSGMENFPENIKGSARKIILYLDGLEDILNSKEYGDYARKTIESTYSDIFALNDKILGDFAIYKMDCIREKVLKGLEKRIELMIEFNDCISNIAKIHLEGIESTLSYKKNMAELDRRYKERQKEIDEKYAAIEKKQEEDRKKSKEILNKRVEKIKW